MGGEGRVGEIRQKHLNGDRKTDEKKQEKKFRSHNVTVMFPGENP